MFTTYSTMDSNDKKVMYAMIATLISLVTPYLGSTLLPIASIILAYLFVFATTSTHKYITFVPVAVLAAMVAVYANSPDLTDVVYTAVAVGLMVTSLKRNVDMRCRMFTAIMFVTFLNITLISPALREDAITPLLVAMQITTLILMSWIATEK